MVNITKTIADKAEPREKDYFIWDDRVPGFGLRVLPSGKKTYQVQYRNNGRTRRMSIGKFG